MSQAVTHSREEFFRQHIARPPAQDAIITLSGGMPYDHEVGADQMDIVLVPCPFLPVHGAALTPALSEAIQSKLDKHGYVIINNCPWIDKSVFEEEVSINRALREEFQRNGDLSESKTQSGSALDPIFLIQMEERLSDPAVQGTLQFSTLDMQVEEEKGMLRLLMSPIGEISAVENEGGDDDISVIKPSQNTVLDERSYKTSGEFELHTDLTYAKKPPEYMGLYIGQTDLQRHAQSQLAHIDDALKKLSPQVIAELQKPNFKFALPDRGDAQQSFGVSSILKGLKKSFVTGAILTANDDSFDVRFRQDTVTGKTAEASNALNELAQAFDSVRFGYFPQPGTLMIVDNRKVAHGRTPFIASHDDDDRHMLRAYVNGGMA